MEPEPGPRRRPNPDLIVDPVGGLYPDAPCSLVGHAVIISQQKDADRHLPIAGRGWRHSASKNPAITMTTPATAKNTLSATLNDSLPCGMYFDVPSAFFARTIGMKADPNATNSTPTATRPHPLVVPRLATVP